MAHKSAGSSRTSCGSAPLFTSRTPCGTASSHCTMGTDGDRFTMLGGCAEVSGGHVSPHPTYRPSQCCVHSLRITCGLCSADPVTPLRPSRWAGGRPSSRSPTPLQASQLPCLTQTLSVSSGTSTDILRGSCLRSLAPGPSPHLGLRAHPENETCPRPAASAAHLCCFSVFTARFLNQWAQGQPGCLCLSHVPPVLLLP